MSADPKRSIHSGKTATANDGRTTRNIENAPRDATQNILPTDQNDNAKQIDLANTAATALLRLEVEIRRASTHAELGYILANEPRAITHAQQIIVVNRSITGGLRVRAITGIVNIEPLAPLILWIEEVLQQLGSSARQRKINEFHARAFPTAYTSVRDSYPLPYLVWLPFVDKNGNCIGGLLQARSIPWSESDTIIGRHIAQAAAHAYVALSDARRSFNLRWRSNPVFSILVGLIALALAVVPVSMTALAPVEVAPRAAFIVTAGVDGVIESVAVSPNTNVAPGDILLRTTDSALRNRFEISEREVNVAESRVKKSQQMAFADARGRHDLAVAQADLDLKRAERDYAREMFARTEIRAARAGVVLFSDIKDLIGRPVAVGEKLMEIADPKLIEFRVDLPARDSIVLRHGARVKVFLDSDPLNPVEAVVERADYQARLRENQELAFRLIAHATGLETSPRLGVRGTAQVYSDRVPLIYYLFRRPLAALRQWSGL